MHGDAGGGADVRAASGERPGCGEALLGDYCHRCCEKRQRYMSPSPPLVVGYFACYLLVLGGALLAAILSVALS
jgi:hypothetical protein